MTSKLLAFFKTNTFYKVLIGIAILLNFVFFVVYLKFDNTPPHWDAGRHFHNSIRYWEYFKNLAVETRINGRTDAIRAFLSSYFYYPPGYYYTTIPFLLFGRTYSAALTVNLVWLILGATSIILFLRKLKFSWISTGISFFFFLGSNFIIGQSREYQLDFPNFVMILILVTSLEMLTQKFDFKNLLFASLAIGFGPLVKWHFLLYSIPILFCYFLRWIYLAIKYKNRDKSYIFQTIFTFFITAFAVNGLWYISNLTRLKIDLTQNSSQTGIAEGDPQGFSRESFEFMLRVFSIEYLGLWWLLILTSLLALAILLVVKNRLKLKNELIKNTKFVFGAGLAMVIFVSMLVYHINQSNKDIRYLIILYLPLILIFALLSEIVFNYSTYKNKLISKIVFSLSFVTFLFFQVNMTLPIQAEAVLLFKDSKIPVAVIPNNAYTNTRLKNKDWAVTKALSKAEDLNPYYLNKDACVRDYYWSGRPTIIADFQPNLTHSNFGTVWGLAEEYGLTISDKDVPCYVIVGRQEPKDKIDVSKYSSQYIEVERYDDWQGLNMVLLRKKTDN